MRVGLFGASYTGDQLRRDPVTRRQALRRSGVAFALLCLVLAGLQAYGYVHQRALRSDGLARAQAEVLSVREQRRGGDSVRVRFTPPDGTPRTARISVRDGDAFAGRDTVDVLYVSSDPSQVRTVDGWRGQWSPRRAGVLVVAFGLVAVLALGAARRTRVA